MGAVDEDADDEGVDGDPEGEPGERIGAEREKDFVRSIGDPRLPSPKEVEDHRLRGHIPYRNWCPFCVEAMGRDRGHFKDRKKERKYPEYSWDYCFPGDEFGYKWTILVGKERMSGAVMATAVPAKRRGALFHGR